MLKNIFACFCKTKFSIVEYTYVWRYVINFFNAMWICRENIFIETCSLSHILKYFCSEKYFVLATKIFEIFQIVAIPYVRTYTYLYMYVRTVCVYAYVYVHMCLYVYICICICICKCICICICTCICICIYTYICICTYEFIRKLRLPYITTHFCILWEKDGMCIWCQG